MTAMKGSNFHACKPTLCFLVISLVTQLGSLSVHAVALQQMETTISHNAATFETRILPEPLPVHSVVDSRKRNLVRKVPAKAMVKNNFANGGKDTTYPKQVAMELLQAKRHARGAGGGADAFHDQGDKEKRIMRTEKRKLEQMDQSVESKTEGGAQVAAMVDHGVAHTSSSTTVASVENSLLGRARSYLGGVSVGVVVAIVFLSFVCGTLFTFIVIMAFKPEDTNTPLRSDSTASILLQAESMAEQLVHDGCATLSLIQEDSEEDRDELVQKFDFEVMDAVDQNTRRWQWCTEKQIQQIGLLTQAPTQRFEGYKRVDVSATEKDVEMLLSAANVDFTAFNMRRHIESVLWRLLRAEAYFMTLKEDNKILLMVETVRIRWVVEGRVLIQQGDKTFLGAKTSLPGIEKPASESPAVAAKRMWQAIFKMPSDTANFVEDSQEDRELIGYKGLRCVERSHIIDVKLTTQTPEVLSKVGLPGHSDFNITDPQDEEVGADLVRKFKWMTTDECKDAGVIWADARMTTGECMDADSLKSDNENPQDRLRKFLLEAGVDPATWDKRKVDEHKTKLAALAKELMSGKCVLTKTSRGLQRCVNVVNARLWSPDRKLMLVEKGRKCPDTTEEWNAQLPTVKKENNESLMDASLRICSQQLRFAEDDVEFPNESAWEYFDYTEPSSRYTGLTTMYQKFFVDVVLEDEDELLKRVGLEGRLEAGGRPHSGSE